jgi:DNA-directed RNA polymerase specialized sigma subunit
MASEWKPAIPAWLRDAQRQGHFTQEEEVAALFQVVQRGRQATASLAMQGGEEAGAVDRAGLERVAEEGVQARNRLFLHHLPLLWRVTYKCLLRVGPAVHFDDLVDAGDEPLIYAIEHFEPDRGYAFSTYAWKVLSNTLMDEAVRLKSVVHMSDHAVDLLRALKKAEKNLRLEHRGEPSHEEVAQAAGCPLETARAILEASQAEARSEPLSAFEGEVSGQHRTPVELTVSGGPRRDGNEILGQLRALLQGCLAASPALAEGERDAARRIAESCLAQLEDGGEAARTGSALDWRIVTRALGSRRPPFQVIEVEKLPLTVDLDQALARRELRLWVLRARQPLTLALPLVAGELQHGS